jgi:uncharacterized protein YjbI with pentapeptide repeats
MTENINGYPVASPPTYLLLIDSRVANYQDIVSAKQPGVYHIVFDPPSRPTHSAKLIKNIEDKIAALGVPAFTSIGLVQHNDEHPIYEMFGRITDRMKPIIHAVETTDPDFQTWNSVSLFITMLRQNYGILNFDMMACALYSNRDWKYAIDKLTAVTGVTVRASTDDTGAASLGGDWFLESHTGVNLKDIYFTDAIENYNGLLYTPPSQPTASTKKLILIDHRIKDIDVIINGMNDDTYCLVFNYFYDTPASILSKLRFLNSDNRYILDLFHYETPEIPTQMDASGNRCTPCDDFDITDIQLLPGTLQNEYLEYTTSAAADASGNGGVWPFYSESTNITIHKPVFFQRAKIGETTESVVYPSTEVSTVILNYKPRPMVLVSDLDEFYELGQNVGEIDGGAVAFECVGIIQHTVDPYIGYKFIGGGDDSVSPAIIQDVVSRDAGLTSWVHFTGFIQSLKTTHQMTTLDMMACALYANPDWKYVIDTLAVRENITIRASLDNTGSSAIDDDANWVLETDNVSLTTVYFTDKIYEWKYVLATYIDTRFNALRWNNPIETNNHTGMFASRAYDSRLKIAAGTNNFTIEAWYYETTARFNCTIVDMGNYNYTFQIRNRNLTNPQGMSLYNSSLGNWLYAESAVVPVAQWSHIAISRSGSTFTFYVNGIASQTFTNSASLQSNDSTFAIGMQSPDNCLCNKMKLDTVLYDIRLWNVARTANEIRMFRNRVVPANSTGLVANYLCTDNGITFNDRSPNALHTTLQSYDASRWSNTTVPIPNVGFLIHNSYSLRTSNSGSALNAFTHFDNITYTDFSGVDLSGVNFRGADLTGCNFTNANLTNANFTNAYLVDAVTTNAITTGSNITQAITNLTSTVLNLDGVDDAVDLGIPTWTYSTQFRTTMTVECWFKTADTNNQKSSGVLVSRNQTGGYSNNSQFIVYMTSSGTIGFGLTNTANTGSYHTTTGTYKDALWHHAAVTYNSSTGVKSIYIDGVLTRSDTAPSGFGLLSNNTTQKLVIGSDDGGVVNGYADRQFRGSMSDVRIWTVVRSDSEIADNYRRRLIGNETGLAGYWKLNQGRGSGWGSYSVVMNSNTSWAFGSIFGAGATPSGSWVVSNINFQPRVSALTLGANSGVYNFSDSSFSFIDPSSNSLGNFSYSVSPSSVATITNGASTTKTIYSLSGAITIPSYTLYEFPVLADLTSWQIDISFTVTSSMSVGGSSTWRALIGDMYNNINSRGWGLWVSSSSRIHWSWAGATAEPATISVSLNTPYVLTAAQSSGTITLTLRNMASTYNSSLSISNLVALYNFDSTSNDTSVNNNHLTNINTVTFNTSDYKRGTAAAAFNGSNYFQINNDGQFSPDNISITFWIKPVSTPGNYQAIASCRNSTSTTDSGWTIYIAGSNLEFWSGAGASWSNGGSLYDRFGDLNTWVHVSFTLNKSTSTLQLYINGSLFSSVSRTYINNTGTTLRIGAGRNEISAGFLLGNGTLLDDFRIYNKILSASEIGTMVAGSSYSSSFAVGSNAIGRGPVSIGGWQNYGGEFFPGTISYVNVSVPTNQRVVTISSATNAGNPATVTAIQDSSFDFGSGSQTASLTVNKIAPTFGPFTLPSDKKFRDASFNITNPTSNSTGLFSYISSNTNVATVTKITFTTTSLLARYDTTQTSNYTLSGTTVSQWNDLTGNGHHLISNGTGPTLTTINSVTAFDFNSGRGFIRSSVPLSSSITVFMVIKYSTNIGYFGSFMHHGHRDTDWAIERNSWDNALTPHNVQFQSNNINGPPELSTTNNTNYILIGRISGSTREFWRYSDTEALGFSTGTGVSIATGNKILYVGKSENNESCNSTIGEILYYNSALSNSDISANFNYLQNKWFNNLDTPSFLTIVGAGTSTITATQAATSNYNSGSVSGTFNVNAIAPTFGPFTIPSAKNFRDASFNLGTPTTDSSGAFQYRSSNLSTATVSSDGWVTIVGAGSTVLTVTQDACGNFTARDISGTLVVSPIAPTTIGTFTIPSAKNFRDASFNLGTPTTDSSGAFQYSSSNLSAATVSSYGWVTIVGAGSTVLTVTQDACGNFTARDISGTLVVSPIAPTFGPFTIPEKQITDISFTLTAPASDSSGIFRFSTDTSGNVIASVTSDGIVTLTGVAGTAIITATQDASGNYTGGSSVTSTLIVNAELSNFTVPSNKVYGDSSFDLTDPTTIYSGEPFIFTSSDTTVASIGGANGRTVTIHTAGSTIVTAKQEATGSHGELTITAVLVIAKKTTVITLSTITKNYGDASFNLSPSSNNTDVSPDVFTITSRNPDIITIFDVSYAAIRGVGSVLIDIIQSESTNFSTGTATIMITINKGTPVLSAFTVSSTRTYTSTPFSAVAYPTSASNGTFLYSSSDSTVATIDSSGIITLLKAGYVNFTATQQATAYYNSVSKTTNTMTVIRQPLALVRSSPTESTIYKTYGNGYFNVIATNDSNGGTITYETNNPSVAGIVGSATSGVISVVSAGTATITARREQTDKYTSDPVSWTVEVARTTTTLSGLSDLSYNVTAAPFTVTASSASDGAVTYSLQNPLSDVITIHPTSGLVTLRSPGSAVIVASQAQGTNYLAPASITATITVRSAGNALQGATITNTTSFASVNLEGASLTGVSITNTSFTTAKLTNANLTNAVIVSANFSSADLSGATLAGASITGATFTAASLKNADLSGAVLTSTTFTGSDLSGARLTGVDASGASFANAKLNNVDLTGANISNVNFTNTSIKGAVIDDVSFSPLQKLQLLKNSENRDIGQIIIPEVTGTTVLAAISESSPLRAIENLDLTTSTVAVVIPTTSTSPTDVLPDVVLNVTTSDKFYLPINESEFFQIEGVKYYATGGVVRNYQTDAVVEVINYNGTPVWLLAGSIVGLVLETNTLNSSSFVIPSRKLITDISPFMPTTLPTSNNTQTPIVYSSSNTNIATIDASSGEITVTGNFVGFVHFTATQVQNVTYEPGTAVSNTLFVDRSINFSLAGLNQTFDLSTLATLDASSISVDVTDATAVFYVRLSDINNMFMYQSDAADITNVSADDIKYYVFHRKWPTELKLNPNHAMMNKNESIGMLGINEGFTNDKSLVKHDFIRYIAHRLFNTIHAVDLFNNEIELNENSVYLGETVRNNIDTILSNISTTSSSGTMSYDASGNKYLTNDASGNTNLCREIMRHIAAVAPSRFYNNGTNDAGLKNVPFIENDTLQYKVVIQAAASQNVLTGVSVIPSRSYTIKLILKNTVNNIVNANHVISDSIMYPNSYPYSSSVLTYPPTSDSSGVYNLYSPPAPIPFARFGYNGWYYTNSTTWVNVEPSVRNHIKWLVGGNTETSKVGDLQYVRINLKIHNTASLPYVMIYTQAGSSRKYVVSSGNGSLTNGTIYSFYMNFNSYAREPAYINHTNAALGYTIGTGSFANNETITSIALESDSNAAASNVEFTLSSIIIGELSTTTNITSEKEYGFEAAVPVSYP